MGRVVNSKHPVVKLVRNKNKIHFAVAPAWESKWTLELRAIGPDYCTPLMVFGPSLYYSLASMLFHLVSVCVCVLRSLCGAGINIERRFWIIESTQLGRPEYFMGANCRHYSRHSQTITVIIKCLCKFRRAWSSGTRWRGQTQVHPTAPLASTNQLLTKLWLRHFIIESE